MFWWFGEEPKPQPNWEFWVALDLVYHTCHLAVDLATRRHSHTHCENNQIHSFGDLSPATLPRVIK